MTNKLAFFEGKKIRRIWHKDEWKNRGVDERKEYAILTNEISKATFGKTVEEYKQHKKIDKENLRDHRGDEEIFLTLPKNLFIAKTTGKTMREREKLLQESEFSFW